MINLLPMAGASRWRRWRSARGAGARKTLQELDLPADTLVAGIIRAGDVHIPRGNSRLYLGDKVILIGRPASFGEALRAVAGEEA